MTESLDKIIADKTKEIKELEEQVDRLKSSKSLRRKDALNQFVSDVVALLPELSADCGISEGPLIDAYDLPDHSSKMVATLETAVNRKGYIYEFSKADRWSESYTEDNCLKMTVYISRDYLEEQGIYENFSKNLDLPYPELRINDA